MKAVYINNFSPQIDLSLCETDEPEYPKATEVLVRVHASGLNRADLLQARGLYPPPAGYSPNIPGLEFAGEIAEIGEFVNDWQIGNRVFGITSGEAQAEYLLTDARLITKIPDNLSYTEAAAVPEAFITAHDALVTQCKIESGENILIHAAGSGVGLAGLQVAKTLGCFVIGTSRTADKIGRCREYGLDAGLTVDDPTNFADKIRELIGENGVDAILDLVGAAYFHQNLASLALGGRLILVGLTSGAKTELNLSAVLQKRARIVGTVLRSRTLEEKAEATKNFVRDIVPHLAAGAIRPNLDRVFDAADVLAAYRYLESNASFGKIVLTF